MSAKSDELTLLQRAFIEAAAGPNAVKFSNGTQKHNREMLEGAWNNPKVAKGIDSIIETHGGGVAAPRSKVERITTLFTVVQIMG